MYFRIYKSYFSIFCWTFKEFQISQNFWSTLWDCEFNIEKLKIKLKSNNLLKFYDFLSIFLLICFREICTKIKSFCDIEILKVLKSIPEPPPLYPFYK